MGGTLALKNPYLFTPNPLLMAFEVKVEPKATLHIV